MQQENILLTDSHFHDWNNPSFPAINAGCSAADLPERISHYSKYPNIYFGAAMGPWEVKNRTQNEINTQFDTLKENIEKYNPLFIGEIGLDYYWGYGSPEIQKSLFEKQMDLACSLNKKVLIHSREASEDTAKIIKQYDCSGVIHCCDGSMNLIEDALQNGYYISFAGNVTYNSNEHLRTALKAVPSNRLLLETDAPYLAPKPFRGKPNNPDLIIYTYSMVAQLLNMTTEELSALIYSNFRAFVTELTH